MLMGVVSSAVVVWWLLRKCGESPVLMGNTIRRCGEFCGSGVVVVMKEHGENPEVVV